MYDFIFQTQQVLNCKVFDVAASASISLAADKTLILTPDNDGILDGNGTLMRWLTLPMAERMTSSNSSTEKQRISFDALTTAVSVCNNGVNRAHILNSDVSGALLLELYTLDGIGTMVSADRYEGTRQAVLGDIDSIYALIAPLIDSGVMSPKNRTDILKSIANFTVVERDGNIIACAALTCQEMAKSLGQSQDVDDMTCDATFDESEYTNKFCADTHAELAAFTVHPDYRNEGRGDSLLVYIEELALMRGISKLFLLTTNTAEWFEERGFQNMGRATSSQLTADLMSSLRVKELDPERGSYLYVKAMEY